jgi:hypothetical protein
LPPFRHDFEQGALDEIAVIIVINDSHKIPVKKPLPKILFCELFNRI